MTFRHGRGVSRARHEAEADVAIKVLPEAFAAMPSGSRGFSAKRKSWPR